MQLTDLRYQVQGPVATITLDRESARNAYSNEMIDSLERAFDAAERDDDVRSVILTGSGKTFSAGGDVKAMLDKTGMFAGEPFALRARYIDGIQRVPRRIAGFEKPLIAAVNGAAIGAGLDLACMCDVRIAADTAIFAESFVKLGIVPGDGGAWLLPRIIGMARASLMTLTGEAINAAQALAYGLVTETVASDALMDRARAIAESIAGNPGHATRMAKRLLREGQDMKLAPLLELSAAYQAIAHHTADHLEAVTAFTEKRRPELTDR
jgi:enoyl-CoA hydratase/carnithine racemase